MSEFNLKARDTNGLDFGDYVVIEQKRHGAENEMYIHKVIGSLRSNGWVDVPVQLNKETLHNEMEPVLACICCGVDETNVRRYRLKDVKKYGSDNSPEKTV